MIVLMGNGNKEEEVKELGSGGGSSDSGRRCGGRVEVVIVENAYW